MKIETQNIMKRKIEKYYVLDKLNKVIMHSWDKKQLERLILKNHKGKFTKIITRTYER